MKLVRQWTIEIEMQCITMNYNEFELPRAPKRQSNSLYNVGTSCSELPDFDLSVDEDAQDLVRTSIFQPDANFEENSRIQICCQVVVFVLKMSICSSQLIIGIYDSEVERFDMFREAFNRSTGKPYQIYPNYSKVPMRIQRKIPVRIGF